MKQTKFLAMAALAMTIGFTSCNNDDDAANTAGEQTLLVQLPASVNTRTVEAPVATSTSTDVEDFTVFILNGQSVVKSYEYVKADLNASKSIRIESVPASMTKVIVVANSHGSIKTLASETAIKTEAFTVASQNVATDGGVRNKTMIGEGVPVQDTDPITGSTHEGHGYKKVTVNLDALTARIEVGGVTAGTGIESLELIGVWINDYKANAAATTFTHHASDDAVWVTKPATSTGTSAAFGVPTIPAYTEAAYYNAADNDNVLPVGTKAYAYQLFAGSYTPHIIFLVKGKFAAGAFIAPNQYFMSYITFTKMLDAGNANEEIKALVANKIYKVGLDGITITSDMITEKPELGTTDLGVLVTTTDWTEVNVTPAL